MEVTVFGNLESLLKNMALLPTMVGKNTCHIEYSIGINQRNAMIVNHINGLKNNLIFVFQIIQKQMDGKVNVVQLIRNMPSMATLPSMIGLDTGNIEYSRNIDRRNTAIVNYINKFRAILIALFQIIQKQMTRGINICGLASGKIPSISRLPTMVGKNSRHIEYSQNIDRRNAMIVIHMNKFRSGLIYIFTMIQTQKMPLYKQYLKRQKEESDLKNYLASIVSCKIFAVNIDNIPVIVDSRKLDEIFTEMLKYHKIETVNLNNFKLNDKNLELLFRLVKFDQTIKSLNLSNTGFSDRTIQSMIEILRERNTTIISIDISKNKISSQYLALIQKTKNKQK